jgi:hypothetical protein
MEKTPAQVIGMVIQLIGVVMSFLFALNKEFAICGFGVLVALLGRAVQEYWDEWF